ncbi:MAG: 2Fe-2S iron-sulfur cluster-binding protein, partial [Acidobacteriota bacterium]
MPKITLVNDGSTYEFQPEEVPYGGHGKPLSLLDLAEHFGFHLEHACGGSCACTTCHVIIKKGDNHLSGMEEDEQDRLDIPTGLTLHALLCSQCIVQGYFEFE